MSDPVKNLIDVLLAVATMAGAVVVFFVGWKQWKIGLNQWERGQAWPRSEQLDKFVQKFETDEFLRLATVILDWSDRRVMFREKPLTVSNDQVLYALQNHSKMECETEFPDDQPTFRDTYDALLAFFHRLELALTTELIDVAPARAYFAYWLQRLILFDQHHNDNKILNDVKPKELVAGYIEAYGNRDSVNRLCEYFGVARV